MDDYLDKDLVRLTKGFNDSIINRLKAESIDAVIPELINPVIEGLIYCPNCDDEYVLYPDKKQLIREVMSLNDSSFKNQLLNWLERAECVFLCKHCGNGYYSNDSSLKKAYISP